MMALNQGGAGGPGQSAVGEDSPPSTTPANSGHAGLLMPKDANTDGIPDTWFQDTNGDGINDLIVGFGALRSLENSYVYTHGLNETGSAAGVCWHANPRDGLGYDRGGFLWQSGMLKTLKDLTGGTIEFRDAYAINNAGQIITDAGGRTFNYANGRACILVPKP